jgi:hypothetical protein
LAAFLFNDRVRAAKESFGKLANSKLWKLAALLTALALFVFPFIKNTNSSVCGENRGG